VKHYKLIFEDFACWGCKACEVACKQEYNKPPFVAYDPSRADSIKHLSVWEDGPKYLDDKLHFMWRIQVCKHCTQPVCATACPEEAISRDPATGIVLLDQEKCTGCNAVAGKSGAEKQGTAPCKVECPAHNDIQGMVSLAAKGKYREALRLLKETSPFPSVCGRVCHHPCESNCNRKEVDDPVGVQSIERFLADQDIGGGKSYAPSVKETRKEKIAVVGSGPAGLSAAYFLARDGYPVTVFEKLPVPGGMMAVGIPAYRLPREILAGEIRVIQDLGVTLKTGVTFGKDITLQGLKNEGYRAVFLATGLHRNRRLNIVQEDLKGVLKGVDFLRDVSLGNPISIGKRVIVIGGGNVAIDVALTSLRKGAAAVTLVCLEQPEEMPAWEHEIQEAREDGVKLVNGFGPNRFLERSGKLSGVEFKRCTAVFDAKGTFHPRYDEKDLITLEAETVIVAIGQAADLLFSEKQGIPVTSEGRLAADSMTLETPVEGVFAGGDAHHGPKSVVEAIASGREAAVSMDRYLRGLSLRADRGRKLNPITQPNVERHDPARRTQIPRLDPRERVKGFDEVRLGLGEQAGVQEAKRCLSCGSCCIQACPYSAITFDAASARARKCNLCHQRVKNGLFPACADNVCLGHCIYFGDPAEIERRVLEKRKMRGGWGEVIPKAITY
jgi:NADPH-dependent glutamate synthase beta subunit-like oxidoreductase